MANETSATPPAPERTRYLPHDLILQILLRLPIESLLRFTAISKTWHSTITSGRCFQRKQHRLQEPCVLIAPLIRSGIGRDQHWRETAAAPPCSVISGRTATFFNGSLIWTIGLNPTDVAVMQGFLRFSLEDESFSIMSMPPGCPEFTYTASNLAEIRGELCLAHKIRPKDGGRAARPAQETWISAYDGADPPRWVLRHAIHTPSRIHLITSSDNDGVVFQDGSCILECSNSRRIEGFMSLASMDNLTYHYPDTNTFVEYPREAVYGYDVLPYVPSLVPI